MLNVYQTFRVQLLTEIFMEYVEACNLLEAQKKLPVKDQNEALITSTEIYLRLLEEKAAKISSYVSKSIPKRDLELEVGNNQNE